MNGQDSIIKKIADDAQAVVDAIKSDTAAKIKALEEQTDKECDLMISEAKAQIESRTAEIKRSRETVTDLDIKKGLLGMRREIIDSVFDKVADALHAMPKQKYLGLISGMLAECAEDGDVVVVAKADKELVTAEFIAKESAKLKKALTLSAEYGDFSGGVILRSKGFDKNLTVEVETQTLREEIETKIAELLFS